MMLEQMIESRFRETIRDRLKTKPDLVRMVLDHERLPLVLENLKQQIRILVLRMPRVKQASLHRVVDDLAVFFAKNCLEHKEQEIMSSAERARRVSAADSMKRAEEALIDLEKEATSEAYNSYRVKTRE